MPTKTDTVQYSQLGTVHRVLGIVPNEEVTGTLGETHTLETNECLLWEEFSGSTTEQLRGIFLPEMPLLSCVNEQVLKMSSAPVYKDVMTQ